MLSVTQGLLGVALGLALEVTEGRVRAVLLAGGVVLILLSAYSLEWLDHHGRKRPRLDVRYSWKDGNDKDLPLEFVNVGDEEARNIRVQPLRLANHLVEFPEIRRLLPGGPSAARAGSDVLNRTSIVNRSLVEAIDDARLENARATVAKANAKTNLSTDEQLEAQIAAEMKAHKTFTSVPLTVTFEELGGTEIEQKYEFHVDAWGSKLHGLTLQFVSEREVKQPRRWFNRLARFVGSRA